MPSTARPARPSAARGAGDDYGATADPDWRTIDWRHHLRQIEVDGARVNYVELGEGPEPPVVFVHGLDGCWQNWLETLPRIARDRRAIALDLPGFGDSERPRGQITISGFADCVEGLCERLGTGPVVVVGNSMGGFVSVELAIRHPDRVEALVLASPAGISSNDVLRRPAMTLGRAMAAVTQSFTAAAAARPAIARPGFRHLAVGYVFRHPTRLAPDVLWESVQRSGSPNFVEALEACLTFDFRGRLPEIACPTLLVWGRDDMVISVDDASEYERLIPNARKLILENTGHVPQLERPQTFNELLVDFLAEGSGLEAAA
jgi:pimeloyl-ACP methyl ester carboxylesterase